MSDLNIRAMAAGKQAVAARTVWQLEVGPVRLRCLKDEDGTKYGDVYLVQIRVPRSGWKDTARGADALGMLQLASNLPTVRRVLEDRNRA